MTFEKLLELAERTGAPIQPVEPISPELPELARNAREIRLVSGEYQPAVYNNSDLIRALEARWKNDTDSEASACQQVFMTGGPKVYFENTPSHFNLLGCKNDLFYLIKQHFSWAGQAYRKFYKATVRQHLHYWLIDRCVAFVQRPHDDSVQVEDRESFRIESAKIGEQLATEYDQRIEKGEFRHLPNAESLVLYERWNVMTRIDEFAVKRDIKSARRRAEYVLKNLSEAAPDTPSDLGAHHDKYL